MIQKKDLVLILISVVCFIGSFLLMPLIEQHQGATGYVYPFGVWYHLLHLILLIIGLAVLAYAVVSVGYEPEG